ncbi:MAG: DUF3198 domain-containing protein [Candidatus Thermoplasmatota archaeon]
MPKGVLTEFRLELAGLFIVVFSFLTVVGVVGVFLEEDLPSYLVFLTDLTEPIGSWAYWLVVVGPLGLAISIWWLYDFVKKTKELDDLIKTPSKAKFVRNLDDIEFLAWSLPQRYEDEVLAKKKEFGL